MHITCLDHYLQYYVFTALHTYSRYRYLCPELCSSRDSLQKTGEFLSQKGLLSLKPQQLEHTRSRLCSTTLPAPTAASSFFLRVTLVLLSFPHAPELLTRNLLTTAYGTRDPFQAKLKSFRTVSN